MNEEKIVLDDEDVLAIYESDDPDLKVELQNYQMCNCCKSCQAGKC